MERNGRNGNVERYIEKSTEMLPYLKVTWLIKNVTLQCSGQILVSSINQITSKYIAREISAKCYFTNSWKKKSRSLIISKCEKYKQ